MTDLPGGTPAALRSNLPLQLTSFLGRERESQAVMHLLSSARLLTLTGPPGCGKTRLALETGRALLEHFPNGVWMVDLSQTSDPAEVALMAARSLGLVILEDTDIKKTIIDYLRHRHQLLVMDNCEHVVAEAAQVCLAILSSCPRVQILATSQLPLGIPGEQEWLVPSLPLPEEGDLVQNPLELRAYAAVRLFEERATAVLQNFTLNPANAPLVVNICRRLDGIPLAIELAAARVKMFTVQEIDRQLDNRFDLLAAPRRLVASRHQTLQSAIDWSFYLLTSEEQVLLCRLAIFTGSFALEGAAEVCGHEPLAPASVVDLLTVLVDRSLVSVRRREAGYTRCNLLESIRLYALARLSEEEHIRLKDRHLEYYARMAGILDQKQSDFAPSDQIDQLEADWPNIQAAAAWVLAAPDRARLYTGLRMTAGFWKLLLQRDHFLEPAVWLERMLALAKTEDNIDWEAARAKAYLVLGQLSFYQRHASSNGREHFETSRELWKKLGPPGRKGYAYATYWISKLEYQNLQMAFAYSQECREILQAEQDWYFARVIFLEGELAERMHNFSQAERKYRELLEYMNRNENYTLLISVANLGLKDVMLNTGRYAEALDYAIQAFEGFERTGSQMLILLGLVHLIETHIALGNIHEAEEFNAQAFTILERTTSEFNKPDIHYNQGAIFLLKYEYDKAAVWFHRSSRTYFVVNFWPAFYAGCLGLAASVAEKDPVWAARLYGFAQKTAGRNEVSMLHKNTHEIFVDRLNFARHLLGDAAFDREVAEGAALSLDEAIPPEEPDELSTEPHPAIPPSSVEKARFSGLTKREREIAARIAQGLTNSTIAGDLVISERTVTTHVTNILSKLGFSSRTQIAAWAVEKGLTGA
jgi:predicted ATPase/DNA-binding CsgD family transcriptional regulator